MRITRKYITEEEFIKLKEMKPFSVLRQEAKSCFSGEVELYIKHLGWKRLEDIIPEINSGEFTPCSDKIEVLTPNGYKQIDDTIFGYTSDWITLKLENESEIRLTPNHNCIVLRNKEVCRIQAKDLILTDQLIQFEIDT